MEENRTFETEEGFSLCLRVRERLQDLYEGYLDAMVAETIRAHLNSCFLCNQEYRDLEQTVRLIESLPYAEPMRDYTPAIMTAIQGQSGQSFQAPVVEVETKSVISQPQSIIKAYPRHEDFGFSISDFESAKSSSIDSYTVRERAAGVFALAAAFLALVLSPFFPGPALAEGYGGMAGSAMQIPLIGSLLSVVSHAFASTVDSVSSVFRLFDGVPSPLISLGGASITAYLFARVTRRREFTALVGR